MYSIQELWKLLLQTTSVKLLNCLFAWGLMALSAQIGYIAP